MEVELLRWELILAQKGEKERGEVVKEKSKVHKGNSTERNRD